MPPTFSSRFLKQPLAVLITVAVIVLIAFLAPIEKTLGANIRIIYIHAAWVWTGKVLFGIAAIAGLLALIFSRQERLVHLTRSLAYTALFFWITYLPMSLYVMQSTWGGFFFDEPRWRIPFMLGIIAVLLQGGVGSLTGNSHGYRPQHRQPWQRVLLSLHIKQIGPRRYAGPERLQQHKNRIETKTRSQGKYGYAVDNIPSTTQSH